MIKVAKNLDTFISIKTAKVDYTSRAARGALLGGLLGGTTGLVMAPLAREDAALFPLSGAVFGAAGGGLLNMLDGYVNEDLTGKTKQSPNYLRRGLMGALLAAVAAAPSAGKRTFNDAWDARNLIDPDSGLGPMLGAAGLGAAAGLISPWLAPDMFAEGSTSFLNNVKLPNL